MSDALAQLRPRALWEHFSQIAAIPRPSKHEERIAGFVRSVAAGRGWEVRSDEVGNLVVRVPATAGLERAPRVILQSHLDMVCEKNGDVTHDFLHDPIRPRVVGDWVHATGTTLGADNGIGLAAALAAATDPDVAHGPLELLCTVDEETGLTGAQGLDARILNGRILLNLDSEEDGKLFVGCAGGTDCQLFLEPALSPAPRGSRAYELSVKGLRGGHSGLNIHENRGNALKLLTRLLQAASTSVDLQLAGLEGGSKHNAIPREARATLLLTEEGVSALAALVQTMLATYRVELAGIDEGLEIRLAPLPTAPQEVLDSEDCTRLLDLLAVVPHGVLGMSPAVPGLVETSNNLAVVERQNGSIRIVSSSRSSVNSLMDAVVQSVRSAGQLAGARVKSRGGYPGWKPDLSSPTLAVVRHVYAELWGREPQVTAVHAGLECGLLGQKLPGLDMISFGPQIEGAHSPDERVQISSVERFWSALVRVLGVLARPTGGPPAG